MYHEAPNSHRRLPTANCLQPQRGALLARWLTILAAGFCLCAAEQRAEEKPDLQQIVGTWQFVGWLAEGQPREIPEGFKVVITREMIAVGKQTEKAQDRTSFRYTIDPSKTPRQMDWLIDVDPANPTRQLAIYSVDDDILKICSAAAGKPRPGEFESRKGDFRDLWILKRMVDAGK